MSKRKDSAYRSGRSPDWLKMKNPACAAVKLAKPRKIGERIAADERRTGDRPKSDHGLKPDGTYVVEFETADGDSLATTSATPCARSYPVWRHPT